jgi:hypothetical protein
MGTQLVPKVDRTHCVGETVVPSISPRATPATGRTGTPASSMASTLPHTLAILQNHEVNTDNQLGDLDAPTHVTGELTHLELPQLSVISDSERTVYGKTSAEGKAGRMARSARSP